MLRNLVWIGVILTLSKGVDAGWVSEITLGVVMGTMIGWAGHIVWLRDYAAKPGQRKRLR